MQRHLVLAYGAACYLLFLAVYAYMAGFFGNFVVPRSIDSEPTMATTPALAINLALVALFALQHSVMARPAFKRYIERWIPRSVERSTYVLFSCLAVILLMCWWQPIGPTLWQVSNPWAQRAIWTLFGIGWLGVPAVSLLINHFDLFGLRQVWFHWQGRAYEPLPFRTPLVYGQVRHPLYVAWAIAFWATPVMTLGHAVLAGGLTLYMLLAVIVEERDLVAHFGEQYLDYARRVPRFVPRLARGRGVSIGATGGVDTNATGERLDARFAESICTPDAMRQA